MRRGIQVVLLLTMVSVAYTAHADTVISDRYGPNDPYYNGSPYIPVPASVLYGCNGPCTSVNSYTSTYGNYSSGYHSDDGVHKGVTYVTQSTPRITVAPANTYYTTTTINPGVPNTGVGSAGVMNLWIISAAVIGAAGAGWFLFRTRTHG